jgi:hypothetical protein
MPIPAPRNKLLPARGDFSDLDSNVQELLDGEMCYAIDQDQYYQKEGSILVPVGATKAQGLLADSALQDAPSDGVQYCRKDGIWSEVVSSGGGGGGDGEGLSTRATYLASSGSIAPGASANIVLPGFTTYALYSIEVSGPAWVRLYINGSKRSADSGRSRDNDPTANSGVIAEIITTGAEKVEFGPAVLGYCSTGTLIPARITNLAESGSSSSIITEVTILKLEA